MAGLIAPLIARYTVNGSYSGRPVANVIDLRIDNDDAGDRAILVPLAASVIVQTWIDNIVENLINNYVASSVSWVDLDNALGSVGETTTGVTDDFPAPGTATGNAMPGNVAIRVNKNIAAARGQRQGRMYLVGLSEDYTDDTSPNSPIATYVTALNADLATMVANLNITFTAPGPEAVTIPVVTHTINTTPPPADPTIEYNGYSEIVSMTVDATLGSQRRRLRS